MNLVFLFLVFLKFLFVLDLLEIHMFLLVYVCVFNCWNRLYYQSLCFFLSVYRCCLTKVTCQICIYSYARPISHYAKLFVFLSLTFVIYNFFGITIFYMYFHFYLFQTAKMELQL